MTRKYINIRPGEVGIEPALPERVYDSAFLESHKHCRCDTISTFVLRFVQRIVRSQEQAFRHPHRSSIAGKRSSDAKTCGDPPSSLRMSLMGEFQGLDAGPHFSRYFDCAGSIGRRKNDSDLLSSVAGRDVGSPHSLLNRYGDCAQAVVPYLMPVFIVELFEVIDVQ